jgi:hypothetical protein
MCYYRKSELAGATAAKAYTEVHSMPIHASVYTVLSPLAVCQCDSVVPCTHTLVYIHYQGDMYEEDYKYSSAANPAPIHYAVDQQNLQGPGAGLRYHYTLVI